MTEEPLPPEVESNGIHIEHLLIAYDDRKRAYESSQGYDAANQLFDLWMAGDAVIERLRVLIDYAVMLSETRKLYEEKGL